MNKQYFGFETAPFTATPGMVFYDRGRHGKVCADIIKNIEEGNPFLCLLADKGVGKTALCHFLLERLGKEGYEVIYLDKVGSSFSAILSSMAVRLGVDQEATLEQRDLSDKVRKYIIDRAVKSRGVILVVDEAEKVFMAGLERLIRFVFEFDEQLNLCLLLAGRTYLSDNVKKLSLACQEAENIKYYRLSSLNQKETGEYIYHHLHYAGLDKDRQRLLFPLPAIEKIYDKSAGNPAKINMVAQVALDNVYAEQGKMVLPAHVQSEQKQADKDGDGAIALVNKKFLAYKWLVAVLFLLLAGAVWFLFAGRGDDNLQSSIDIAPLSLNGNSDGILSPVGKIADQGELVEDNKDDLLNREEVEPVVENKDMSESQKVSSNSDGGTEKQEKRDGDKIFSERLMASTRWIVGGYQGKYTVLLFKAFGHDARDKVKSLLVQDDYFNLVDNLYIQENKYNNPMVVLSYGSYDSIDEAREARNKLPLSMRKYNPFPVLISDSLSDNKPVE